MVELTKEEYNDLKEDPQIRDAIWMLQDIYFKFERVTNSNPPTHTKFLYGNFAKIPITKKERTAIAKKIKSSKRKAIRTIIKQTKNLIKNGFIDVYLCSYLNTDKKLITEVLTEYTKHYQDQLDDISSRVRPDSKRDFWLGEIIIALHHMGYTRPQRIDFILKLYLEADCDLYATYMYGEEEKPWANEMSLKDVIRKVDDKTLKPKS